MGLPWVSLRGSFDELWQGKAVFANVFVPGLCAVRGAALVGQNDFLGDPSSRGWTAAEAADGHKDFFEINAP